MFAALSHDLDVHMKSNTLGKGGHLFPSQDLVG